MLPVARARSSLLAVGLAGALALAGTGCGGPDAKSPKSLVVPNPFPTKSALEKLARAPLKSKPGRAVASVPEWRVDPTDVPDVSPVERRLVERSSAAKRPTFTRELRCIARELGRLRAEHGADADERVQRFIIGACGRTDAGGLSTFHLSGEAPAELSDDELLEAWKGQLALPASFDGKAAGAWLTRKGTRAVVMFVGGEDRSDVTLSPSGTPGVVTVRGTAAAGVEQVMALVNQGREGVARCEPNKTAPPRSSRSTASWTTKTRGPGSRSSAASPGASSSGRRRSCSRAATRARRWSSPGARQRRRRRVPTPSPRSSRA